MMPTLQIPLRRRDDGEHEAQGGGALPWVLAAFVGVVLAACIWIALGG